MFVVFHIAIIVCMVLQSFSDGDPLANFGMVKFYITNVGKDGVGAVTSCGQGSVWRVDALSGLHCNDDFVLDWKKQPETVGRKVF
jgi:hypothetical protein